jgi:Rrf2 family protein
MKLSRASSYALHALAFLAAQDSNQLVSVRVMGQNEYLPYVFTRRQLTRLEKAHLVRARKGPGGGYCLAWPSSRVSLLEIIEAIDGPIRGYAPFYGDKANPRLHGRLHAICDQAVERLRARLAKVRLSHLIGKGRT